MQALSPQPRRLGPLLVMLCLLVTVAVPFYCLRGDATREDARGTKPAGIVSTPLRAATGGETPRFKLLAPSASGLDFTNVLRKENCFQYLTNGAGLAAGDYDGDGLV